jgi:hypothetical protein
VHRRESAEAPISSVDSENLTWRERARHAYQTNLHWASRKFTPWVLNTQWRSRYHSVLAMSPTTLAIGAGNTIYTYTLSQGGVREDLAIQVHRDSLPATDITGLAFLPTVGATRQMLIADMSGRVVRIRANNNDGATSFPNGRPRLTGPWYGKSAFMSETARYDHPHEAIKALSTSGSMALTISTTGLLSLFNTSTPWLQPSTYHSQKTGWACHLQLEASTPFAATGLHSGASIIPIRQSGFDSSTPSSPLARLGGPKDACPVYSISAFLPGSSPDIITTGWYDGKVRVHDLRLASTPALSPPLSLSHLSGAPLLKPVLTLSDPWRSFDAIYSLSARGVPSSSSGTHSHHYITAGSAQHSVVAIWDVRSPRAGWSVYAPGGDRSPVYGLLTEGSRIWGTTQSRAFMLDFAGGSAPWRGRWPRVDGVARDSNGAFAAAAYSHH